MKRELRCNCGFLIGLVDGNQMHIVTEDAEYICGPPVAHNCSDCDVTIWWYGDDPGGPEIDPGDPEQLR